MVFDFYFDGVTVKTGNRYKWVKILEQNYRSSCFLSLRENLHPSKCLGNVFKINFISVFRISEESTKTPVCKQLSHSEYEPTHGCFFLSWLEFTHSTSQVRARVKFESRAKFELQFVSPELPMLLISMYM